MTLEQTVEEKNLKTANRLFYAMNGLVLVAAVPLFMFLAPISPWIALGIMATLACLTLASGIHALYRAAKLTPSVVITANKERKDVRDDSTGAHDYANFMLQTHPDFARQLQLQKQLAAASSSQSSSSVSSVSDSSSGSVSPVSPVPVSPVVPTPVVPGRKWQVPTLAALQLLTSGVWTPGAKRRARTWSDSEPPNTALTMESLHGGLRIPGGHGRSPSSSGT